ncbi:unnamed protein product [Auanema sp. JU1783]|nr:unnamed protein product [Auanema sp. JU1783]
MEEPHGRNSYDVNASENDRSTSQPPTQSNYRTYVSIVVLFFVNLLNYMDRFTIAGVLTDIQKYYKINDAQGGLLQTVFIVFFMIFSPVCGYLGDRYNRKWIMVVGLIIWILAVLASTFVSSEHFWLFLLFRGIVGIGEASYATISPTIIADMFTGSRRSNMLMLFYFAIPVGCGCGFIVGSEVAALFGSWKWGVRITAILGAISVLATIIFVYEPERGKAERESGEIAAAVEPTSYLEDIKSLLTNATYITSTLGYTAIIFVVGTMSWWVPTAVLHKDAWKESLNSTDYLSDSTKAQVNMIFGAITCVGGIAGVFLGTLISSFIRNGTGPFRYIQTPRSDAIICGVGAVIGIPTFFVGVHLIPTEMVVTWIMMFICITALCFNWATNVDMQMMVVVPHRRNTANSWQILTSHLLGDASGPYIIGLISDAIRGSDNSPKANFYSLLKAFYIPNVILILSALLFAIAAMTFVRDQRKFAEEMGTLREKPADTITSNVGSTNEAFVMSKHDLQD